ncbi:MAG: arylesterase [Bryobacteraceae bacterium]|nr:arylesterase [Bryobacteraceae bacterium]
MTDRCYLALIPMLALAACGGKQETPRPPAAASAPAAVPEPAKPADTRPVIVALGDSLTAGLGVEPGQAWPEVLQRILDRNGRKYRIVNQGISGDTTSGGLARIQAAVDLKPVVTILELGANDGLRGLPVKSTEENLARMIERLQAGGSRVLLAGITLPRNYGPDYIRDFDRIFPAMEKKYKVARLPFLLEGVALDPALMQRDALHPNAAGHERIANLVWKYLEPLLG